MKMTFLGYFFVKLLWGFALNIHLLINISNIPQMKIKEYKLTLNKLYFIRTSQNGRYGDAAQNAAIIGLSAYCPTTAFATPLNNLLFICLSISFIWS